MPEQNADTSPGPARPEDPLDRMILALEAWLDQAENQLQAQSATAKPIPDDIPHFVTRYRP